jgi:hypothetical protein
MTKNKINIYVSSKNRKPTEKANDFEVSFPSGLIKCDPKTEYLVLNINGWVMKNEFYNTQEINNEFNILIGNSTFITYTYKIPVGNYSVLELLAIMKGMFENKLNVEYDVNLNKYRFMNNILTNKTIKIVSVSANDFIGFPNGVENIIPTGESIYSLNPINMAGDELVCLKIPNIQTTYPLIDNFSDGVMKDNDIVAYLAINVPPFALMEYKNEDAGDSFSYRLEDSKVDSMRLVCCNQDLENIDVGEYQLSFQFEVHKKITEYDILKKLERLVSNIFQWLGKDEPI